MTSVPFLQIQNALIQAIYPEFRNHRAHEVAREIWTDMLVLAAWVGLPAGVAGAIVVPQLVPFLFGDGWTVAAILAAPLALAGGLQLVATLLSSALEAVSKFSWIWATNGLLLVTYGGAALGVVQLGAWWPALLGLVAAPVLQHVLQVVLCSREGRLSGPILLRGYAQAAVASAFCAALLELLLLLLAQFGPWTLFPFGGGLVVVATVFLRRSISSLPPVRILQRYGILG